MDGPLTHSFPRSPSPAPPLPLRPLSPPPTAEKAHDETHVPIPWRSLFPILFLCYADACTYGVVFPFITDMITSFEVPEDKIGLYSGLGEGVMMLVEACMATTWARLADKRGRRWAILYGFSVTLIAMPLLGFSRAVWHVVFCRAMLGLTSVGVLVKICANELAHPSTRTRIFSTLSPAFGLGFLVGTFLGGELTHPFGRLPWWLGGTSTLFRDHPYALPCLAVFGFDGLAILFAYLYLPETQRPSKTKEASEHQSKKSPLSATLKVPSFLLATAVTCLFHVSNFSWDGMFGVFTYTATERGGLGLPVDYIGILYSVGALISIIVQPIALPRFRRALGDRWALTIVLASWTTVALIVPISQWCAVHTRPAMWGALATIQSFRCVGNFAWPLTDILTMAAFDDYPELMATGSAISLVASAGGRAFGPAISGWLFSISTTFEAGSLGRQVSWLYLVAVTLPGVILAQLLPHAEKARPPKDEYEQVPLVESGYASGTSTHFEENADALHSR